MQHETFNLMLASISLKYERLATPYLQSDTTWDLRGLQHEAVNLTLALPDLQSERLATSDLQPERLSISDRHSNASSPRPTI